MANPRKFSEKIALLNQKQAEETAAFEAIMREVSDVTSRVASASSSVGASPTGSGVPEAPLSVKSAGASPPQSSSKHLHINLGNQFRPGGSLPNVNNNIDINAAKDPSGTSAAIHSIDLKTALSNLEEMQHNSMSYRNNERGRSMGVGPVRPRPMEKRHDTSPYNYLSPPPSDTWRRTNSDSALHQSANEACHSSSSMPHRRGSDAYQHMVGTGNENRELRGLIERPRSSCEMPRVPGINIYPSAQPPGQQIPISNNTGSLPDLSNVHFASPLHTPLDQEEHSSGGSPYSNNHLSVPVNSRYLPTFKGVALENSTSTSPQDLQSYSQQPSQQTQQTNQCQGHYIYQQQSHSPIAQPQSPKSSQSPQQPQQASPLNSLGSYRTPQPVNRPSPQSSPSLTLQGSPLSYSNNPSTPSSPMGGHMPHPNLTSDSLDQNSYYINQVHSDFEQFSMGMDWVQMMQQLADSGYALTTQLELDSSPSVTSTTMGTYIGSPNHTSSYSQNDTADVYQNVSSDLGSGDAAFFSATSLQIGYRPRTPTTTQQLTPQTPNTPTITLTDCSLGTGDLSNSDFTKDLVPSIVESFSPDIFSTDDSLRQDPLNALRHDLDPLDIEDLQRLADNSDMVISDPCAEAHFRLEHR
ncbi:CREB-regulated transcription coactivator 1-like isoform X4 [Leptopilina heterotoma]|uniref:CREB-regulated transcription coactivator 1-like isoform X4 n=1 Tax=Leptopilina heterotoma TaxID=63436 RepID=UPI001CA7C45D|nr:CREB-regulated transcription coactivator 1-like isoform X4 [Leptopilina heterotoma]